MNGNGRDNIVIGLMVIFTYFLIYAFLGSSQILQSMGGLPLINCTADLIENGFSGVSMWFVRNIVFLDKTGEILQMFIAIFSVVLGGLGAVFASPLRRIITRTMTQRVLRDNLLNSRPVQWLASSFFITTVILFLAVVIEMTVGLTYFFSVIVAGFPAILTMILMLVGVCFLIWGGFRRE